MIDLVGERIKGAKKERLEYAIEVVETLNKCGEPHRDMNNNLMIATNEVFLYRKISELRKALEALNV